MKNHIRQMLYLTLFFLLLIASNSFAQEVSNISFKQDGAQVVISYDLDGNEGDLYNTTAYYSIDDGKTWTRLVTVKGDLLRVSPGTGKTISWEVLKDVTGIKGSISFKVEATKSKERIDDKKGFLVAAEILGAKIGYVGKKWGINATVLSPLPYERYSFYLSITRNIITKEKYKWNAGLFLGIAEYVHIQTYYPREEYRTGTAFGITNELQFKKIYFNLDLLYHGDEEDSSQILPVIGVGIVF